MLPRPGRRRACKRVSVSIERLATCGPVDHNNVMKHKKGIGQHDQLRTVAHTGQPQLQRPHLQNALSRSTSADRLAGELFTLAQLLTHAPNGRRT